MSVDEETPEIPKHLVDHIFDIAGLNIDTKVALSIPPKRLVIDEGLSDELEEMCKKRASQYQEYLRSPNTIMVHAFYGKTVPVETRKEKQAMIYYLDIGGELRMQFEMTETTHPDPDDPWAHLGGETEVLRMQCCIVGTGEPCHRLIGDGESDWDTDSD